jgi:hypothetical protein
MSLPFKTKDDEGTIAKKRFLTQILEKLAPLKHFEQEAINMVVDIEASNRTLFSNLTDG